ncbi:DUF6733 family protein [uncultured Polaribacter sp.]|uniref:DUF6733 family protein n=1 Tax=uncultured Polaribacter sp. TaxID=174711 RepID=UPI00260D7F5F|nr:DUF6733 family protein [uncultured Polaribacter sp.]
MTLKKLSIGFTFLMLFSFTTANAQTDDKLSIGLSLNQDAFFGFNPMMTGAYELSDTSAFTFYGIQWGGGSAGASWGQWTEFGLGYNFTVGDFDINPQLGFTMGSLLSSGAQGPGVIGDGIVPNLTVNHGSDKLEGQFYIGYYAALADETTAGQATNNYVHYWANLGYKVSPFFSFGAHIEELFLSGGDVNGGGSLDRVDGYFWAGPYVQFQKNNAGLRFSFGGNLADEDERFATNDFYRLTFFISL